MKEYKIIIDGKLYNLPLADLYIDKFSYLCPKMKGDFPR